MVTLINTLLGFDDILNPVKIINKILAIRCLFWAERFIVKKTCSNIHVDILLGKIYLLNIHHNLI